MTRIATSFYYKQMTQELGRQQTALADTQNQIGSGKSLLRPSDDPSASSRLLDINQAVSSLEQYRRNGTVADQRLSLMDSTLDSVGDLLTRVREMTVAASNTGAIGRESFQSYKVEIEERLAALVDLANTRGDSGQHIFSGFRSKTQPFVEQNGQVIYQGDQGRQEVRLGPNRNVAISESGDQIFLRVPDGNGRFAVSASAANTGTGIIEQGSMVSAVGFGPDPFEIRFTTATTFDVVNVGTGATVLAAQTFATDEAISFNNSVVSIQGEPAAGDVFTIAPSSSQSVFDTFSNLIAALDTPAITPVERTEQKQAIDDSLANLERSIDHVLEARARVGARQNAVSSAEVDNEATVAQLEITKSQIQDLDYAEAIGRFQFQLTTLEAVQKTFSELQSLSLMQTLRL